MQIETKIIQSRIHGYPPVASHSMGATQTILNISEACQESAFSRRWEAHSSWKEPLTYLEVSEATVASRSLFAVQQPGLDHMQQKKRIEKWWTMTNSCGKNAKTISIQVRQHGSLFIYIVCYEYLWVIMIPYIMPRIDSNHVKTHSSQDTGWLPCELLSDLCNLSRSWPKPPSWL